MARLLVFDTQAVNDTMNNWGAWSQSPAVGGPGTGVSAVDGSNTSPIMGWADYSAGLPVNQNNPGAASYPVRLIAADGLVRNIAWEFVLTGSQATLAIQWYQEFYNDRSDPNVGGTTILGGTRNMGLPQYCPFVREQTEELAGAGAITHYDITRTVTMRSLNNSAKYQGDCRYFPMIVNALWVRLRVYTTTALTLPADYPYDCVASPAPQRLRIFAIVGGYDQAPTMESNMYKDKLWATFNGRPIVWNPANPGHGTYTGTW